MNAARSEYQPSPAQDERIRTAFRDLRVILDERTAARNQGNEAQAIAIEELIPLAIRRVGDAFVNEESRQYWYRQAEDPKNFKLEQSEHMVPRFGEHLVLEFAAPPVPAFMIVGDVMSAARLILHDAATALVNIGTSFQVGLLRESFLAN